MSASTSRVCNGGGPYIDQWYDTKADFNSSTPVVLAAGDDRQGVNAQLATSVSVAGQVTDGNGNPIPGISVSVNPTNQGSGGFAQTDSNGNYTTGAVAPGDYRVQFAGNSAWATQYWNAKLSWNGAGILTLSAADGPVRGGIDATLTAAATITGLVTTPGGTPAARICVNAAVDSPNGPDQVANTTTAQDGTYTLAGLPATAVKVDFQDCNSVGPYIEQWWNNRPDSSSADALTLAVGETRTGIDAQLAAAAEIAGTVTDSTGNPLRGICAQATTTTFFGGLAHTDANGNYAINLAKPGDYRVQFVDCNLTPAFAGQWWHNQPTSATSNAVTLAAGQVVRGVDARLSPGAVGTISGKIGNLHGIAMTAACVIAYLPDQYLIFASVNPDGTYKVANVPSGTYALAFLGCNGGNPTATVQDPESTGTNYNAVWWDGAPIDLNQNNNGSVDPIAQGANLVTVTPGQNLTGYNHCFGCTAISISSITPRTGSLTVAFTTPGLVTSANGQAGDSAQASALTYTVACTSSTGGAPDSASGPSSPITVTGLTAGATYTCQVTASDRRTTVAASAVSDGIVVPASPPASIPIPQAGYVLAGSDGGMFAFGPAAFPGAVKVSGDRVVSGAPAGAHGSWLTAADGSVFTTGDAKFEGSLRATKLNSPIVGITAHGSDGYWLVAADGGVFSEGSVDFHGSLGAMKLNSPIVGMTPTPSGNGYWLVAKDGSVFAFGDAQFYGSLGATKLNSPIVGITATPSGHGYTFVASDGGVFAYGDAVFAGSRAGSKLNSPIVAIVPTTFGTGYWLVAKDGGVFAYGTATFDGSMAASKLNAPIVAAW